MIAGLGTLRNLLEARNEVRKSIPRIDKLDHNQFDSLTRDNHVDVSNLREKPDGTGAIQIGHDQHGFYSQSSGSGDERMRSRKDYIRRATRRAQETGKPLDLSAAHVFGDAHERLAKNPKLMQYLKHKAHGNGGETKLKGELFYRPKGVPSDEHPDHVKFVNTSYHTSHLGKTGALVIHTGMPDNKHHDIEHLKAIGDEHIKIHDDKRPDIPHAKIDVTRERSRFEKLDRELLSSRTTKKNKVAKEIETGKLDALRKAVHRKVEAHLNRNGATKSKWGSDQPEGMVIHPPESKPDAPRVKIQSKKFEKFKSDAAAQAEFKKRIGK